MRPGLLLLTAALLCLPPAGFVVRLIMPAHPMHRLLLALPASLLGSLVQDMSAPCNAQPSAVPGRSPICNRAAVQ